MANKISCEPCAHIIEFPHIKINHDFYVILTYHINCLKIPFNWCEIYELQHNLFEHTFWMMWNLWITTIILFIQNVMYLVIGVYILTSWWYLRKIQYHVQILTMHVCMNPTISQIPQWYLQVTHSATLCKKKCICTYIFVTKWCIVGYGTDALEDLWNGPMVSPRPTWNKEEIHQWNHATYF